MPKYADDIRDVPDEFMDCSFSRKHEETYRNEQPIKVRGRVVQVEVYRYCGRCGHETYITYSLPGWVVIHRDSPRYPDYYLVRGGVTAAERKDEWARRKGWKFEASPPKVPAAKRRPVSSGKTKQDKVVPIGRAKSRAKRKGKAS